MSYISLAAHPAIELPLPPEGKNGFEIEVYARFMRHLRHVPCSRAEIKVLSSIQFAADMMGASDEHVAKVLVECGLRAPRVSFPEAFLRHIDQSFLRSRNVLGAPTGDYIRLAEHWHEHGEDPFAPVKHQPPVLTVVSSEEERV